MILSLIGMSNVGKSHWAKRLEAEQGFTRMSCDDLIARELCELLPAVEIRNMDAFAAWKGMPYEFGYAERERAYRLGEEAALTRVLEEARQHTNVVIDTTGSVVYMPQRLLDRLRALTTVVHLSTTQLQVAGMTERFFSNPKPLVWGSHFDPRDGESHEAALRRCYPDLLAWRQEQYMALADVAVPFEVSHDPSYTPGRFLYDVLQHKR